MNDTDTTNLPDEEEVPDVILISRALNGDMYSFDVLVRRHQPWVFNLALRMLAVRANAEDATQEIMIKVVTKLDSFRAQSRFRTWVYRIAVNHLLNMRQSMAEQRNYSFVEVGRGMDADPDLDLPDPRSVPVDVQLLVQETRHTCMAGMLLCLDRRQRVAYILGEIFGVTSDVGGEAMDETPENFRQLLSRARRDLYQFMANKCGLVNQANPCRCAKKTRAFMNAGFVDPHNLRFTRDRVAAVDEIAPERADDLSAMDRQHARMHRENAFLEPQGLSEKLRDLIKGAGFDRDDATARERS